jgi:hypothetical protein
VPNGIKTTGKEFEKLSYAMHKDPNVLVQSMAAKAQNNGGPKPGIDMKVVPPPPVNNPIELPEN